MSLLANAYAVMSVLLAASGIALLYPIATGTQVVVYRKAVVALGTSAMLFVVGWLVTDITFHGFLQTDLVTVVGSLVITVAGVLHLVAVWLFARDFVQFGDQAVTIDVDGGASGGFGDE